MCLCYCVLGFAAHSNISGDDSDCGYPSDMDLYDYLGYGTDFSRSVQTSTTISCETPVCIILYVLRDVRTLFMYYF